MATEIKHLQNYIVIQEIRFGFTFEVEWKVQPEVMDAQVLKFILQPVIENAKRGGKEEFSSGGSGLHNVYHRLQTYYRGEASMTIRSKRLKGTVVQLIVPLAMP
ncbi:hypothetical protein A8990_1408 [Paenibacillus taihuensis]|uniref:Uncharacterized protein n=1 Tax=Paenibacillus taihuensis TaxID=1156355 RepID=A0A3D9R1X2_9BACL|nr:hypothetical protein [Paenibacillus taihuensis]REE67959.1 hypothetical protein A8990_1408 [Paenibacillus taihuensis]